MLDNVPEFRKNQGLAGQFAGFQTPRHAENGRFSHHPRRSTRHDGGGIDLLEAELGEQYGKGSEFLVKTGFLFIGAKLLSEALYMVSNPLSFDSKTTIPQTSMKALNLRAPRTAW